MAGCCLTCQRQILKGANIFQIIKEYEKCLLRQSSVRQVGSDSTWVKALPETEPRSPRAAKKTRPIGRDRRILIKVSNVATSDSLKAINNRQMPKASKIRLCNDKR